MPSHGRAPPARFAQQAAPILQLTHLSNKIRDAMVWFYGVVPVTARPEFYRRQNFTGEVTFK